MAREYDIAKSLGACSTCGRELAAGEQFVAALFETAEGFGREDLCRLCWEGRADDAPKAFSVWHSRVPAADEPKKRFVDNQVLADFFEKLDGPPGGRQDEPSKVNFRFVLALMLMRKKLLVYDGVAAGGVPDGAGGREVWKMHFRGEQATVEVIRPELNEEQIAEVGAQLGTLFEVET